MAEAAGLLVERETPEQVRPMLMQALKHDWSRDWSRCECRGRSSPCRRPSAGADDGLSSSCSRPAERPSDEIIDLAKVHLFR